MLKFKFVHVNNDTFCVVKDKHDIDGTACASCRPEDLDMHTNLTGEQIAYLKATEKYYHKKAIQMKKEIKKINDLRIYLFPNKFFSEKVSKDTQFGVQMVQDRMNKKIVSYEELYNEYRKLELESAMAVKSYIMNKCHLFKKIREKKKDKARTK